MTEEPKGTVIRDDELGGLAMIPVFVKYGIKRCNVEGCKEKPTTIVTQLAENVPVVAFCEEHYQLTARPEGMEMTLVFDDYDAFIADREEETQKEEV